MGRPRKDGATQKVRERLISVMADRLIREPVDAVTVTSLIKEVGCNRSTFYYYFADTEQLAEAALAQRRVKQRLLEDVLPDLDVSLPANDDDPTFRIVFEYATGGLLALMAYRAETDFAYPVETFLQCLAPEVPAALLTVLLEKG